MVPCLVAFDLDGTLVDSRLDLAESANELLEGYGAHPLAVDRIVAMVGEGAKVLVARALAAAGIAPAIGEALERFLAIYDRRLLGHTHLYPGAIEALDEVRGRTYVAMLTNKPGPHTRRLIDALGIGDRFNAVIGGDAEFPRKPDPAGLRHLMMLAGASADDTLMVGDSRVDIETARRAGAVMCVAGYGFDALDGTADLVPGTVVAARPEDLRQLLRNFVTGRCAPRA